MVDRKRTWLGRVKPTKPPGSHFFETTYTRDRQLAQAKASQRRTLPTSDPVAAEFSGLEKMIDVVAPDFSGIVNDNIHQEMDIEGDRVFLEAEIGKFCEAFETQIPAYFSTIDTPETRRQGTRDRYGIVRYLGETPLGWHIDPSNKSRRTYYYKFHFRGRRGSGNRVLLRYEQGLTRDEVPYNNEQNLTHLSVGINEQGKIHALHIYPPHPSYVGEKAASVPYGITRIDETPRLRAVLDVLHNLNEFNNGWIHLDFKDRKHPSLTLANKYTFAFTDKGFTLTEPEKDKHNLAGKLDEIITAQGYAFLVEEMLNLVELHEYTKSVEATIKTII